jgi:hypothetical protein
MMYSDVPTFPPRVLPATLLWILSVRKPICERGAAKTT